MTSICLSFSHVHTKQGRVCFPQEKKVIMEPIYLQSEWINILNFAVYIQNHVLSLPVRWNLGPKKNIRDEIFRCSGE